MYFKTKWGLVIGCSIFENTVQWKMFLKDLGLSLLLFRMCEFIHNSSFTFPEGPFIIQGIGKVTRLRKLQSKNSTNVSVFNYFSYWVASVCQYSVSHGHLETVLSLQRFTCPAFSTNLCKLSTHSPKEQRLSFYWQIQNQSAEWDNKNMTFRISHVNCFSREIYKKFTCIKHRNIYW